MIEIKILGTGCPKCKTLYDMVIKKLAEKKIIGKVEKITDISDIIAYGVISTPALVINDQIVHSGGIPKESDLDSYLEPFCS